MKMRFKPRLSVSKLWVYLSLFTLMQLFLFTAVSLLLIQDGLNNMMELTVILGAMAALLVTMGMMARYVVQHLQMQEQYKALSQAFNLLEKVNREMSEQRHDFMNHLQVVYGLVDMNERQDAIDYMQKLIGSIAQVREGSITHNPAVNALIMAKAAAAKQRGIHFHTAINTPLDAPGIPSWSFCGVLANLIDNAIEALEGRPGMGEIQIALSEDSGGYRFTVGNNGPQIPVKMLNKIFEPGFTTKKREGHGMGLDIVKRTVTENDGTILVNSSRDWTAFTGWMPRCVLPEGGKAAENVN